MTTIGSSPTTGELRSVWLMHTVLRNEFQEQRPKPGERLGIKRLPDSERGYRRFALRIDRGPQEEIPDFGAYGAPTDVFEAPHSARTASAAAPEGGESGGSPF